MTSKRKLLHRVRRIHGQLHAVEKALEEEGDPSDILQTLVSAHGAMKSLMAEIITGHIEHHVLDPKGKPSKAQLQAAGELASVIKTYLR